MSITHRLEILDAEDRLSIACEKGFTEDPVTLQVKWEPGVWLLSKSEMKHEPITAPSRSLNEANQGVWHLRSVFFDGYHFVLTPMQLRKAFQMMLSEYKVVTDKEKAEVVSLGGLHVIGTERHESRRIDNQLRGRSGRQGDPGSTR